MVGYLLQNPAVGMVGHGIVEVAADDGRRALRPGELIRFDLKSESGPATFKRVTCFLGTSRLTCRRSVLERLLPIPEALVIEADEYLFTLGGAVAEVAVLDEPLTLLPPSRPQPVSIQRLRSDAPQTKTLSCGEVGGSASE